MNYLPPFFQGFCRYTYNTPFSIMTLNCRHTIHLSKLNIHLLIHMQYSSPKVKRQCTSVYICIFIWIYITILSESHYNTTECFQTHLLHCCYNATWELKGISVIIGENHNYKKFTGQSKVFPHHIFCSPASKIGRLLNLYCGLVMVCCSKLLIKGISMT